MTTPATYVPVLWSAIEQWLDAHDGHALVMTTHALTDERVVECVTCRSLITELGTVVWR
jgi:hypothetical protein